jgi:hypothetical protein
MVRMAQQRLTFSLAQHRASCDDLPCVLMQNRDRQDRDKITAVAVTPTRRRQTFVRNCWFSPVQCLLRGGRTVNAVFE